MIFFTGPVSLGIGQTRHIGEAMHSYWILWYLSGLGPSVTVEQIMPHEESEVEPEKPFSSAISNDDPLILNTPDPRQTGRPTTRRSKPRQRSQIAAVDQSYEVDRTPKHQQRGRGKWQ
ncbi:MAG: hypothetical protein KBD29_03635 [Candidatus Magasanikbacteria bacterium]|nr:hypothetical protein [Candidatus Magasanikbacteria bacterium]